MTEVDKGFSQLLQPPALHPGEIPDARSVPHTSQRNAHVWRTLAQYRTLRSKGCTMMYRTLHSKRCTMMRRNDRKVSSQYRTSLRAARTCTMAVLHTAQRRCSSMIRALSTARCVGNDLHATGGSLPAPDPLHSPDRTMR
eukprot:3937058-Rhodomonas_salina.5